LSRLPEICLVFGAASLLSSGGGNAIVPELQRQTVDQFAWLTAQQFADCFAIAQIAPGPSTLLVTLLGYQADGLAGALAATVAMVLPAALLAWLVARSWVRTGHARWHIALQHGLAPVGVGLVAASGVIITLGVDRSFGGFALTAAAAAALLATKLNPLAVVGAGGVVGLLAGGI
jgi:chromate transporter